MVSSNKRYCQLVQKSYLSDVMNGTVRVRSAQYTIVGKCFLIAKLTYAVQLARLCKLSRGHGKATHWSQIIELARSSCLLELYLMQLTLLPHVTKHEMDGGQKSGYYGIMLPF